MSVATRARWGGTEGNERLTCGVAVVLTLLLVVEGVTIIWMGGLVTAHLFVGLMLIPPVALKLGSTGYRFARYYLGTRAYRAKGPPLLALRLLAPLLVLTTVVVFGTGVWLLVVGHKAGTVLEAHKVAFIVWGVVFAVHFLAYVPRVVRALRPAGLPGTGLRAALVAASVGAGVALALALLSPVTGWG